ncbi:hypothetical protein ZWY2020_012563 [Hordeum vulgare]|nr:hypothetical protein ZWY2020_012563 [Hordeum vulgare]
MVRLGPLAAQHAGPFARDLGLGSPAALLAFAVVAAVAVAAVAAFGCAKGAKKPRRQDNNNVYYYGQGYPPPPPAGAYGYPPPPGYAYPPPPVDAGRKQGGRMGAGAGLALGAGAGLATGVIVGSALSSGCGGGGQSAWGPHGGQLLGADEQDNTFGWDNKHAGARILLSKSFLVQKVGALQEYKAHADSFIYSMVPGTPTDQTTYTRGGLLFKLSDSNMQYVTSNSLDVNHVAHVDYLLGSNPMGMSYMVGYGAKYPKKLHHWASSLPSVAAHPG